MVFWPNICACPVECETYSSGVMFKKLIRQSSVANKSLDHQTYTCSSFFAEPDLKQEISLFEILDVNPLF
jgi:hypothetical protein